MVKKVNAINTSKLVNKTYYNANIKYIEDKVPKITNLATTAAVTAIKNKILNVSNIANKVDCVAKVSDIGSKYFIPSDYNEFTNNILDAKITKRS